MTAQELLESLNLLDENERIEAKSANEAGKSLLETICAFANEPGLGGGWLLLEVARDELSSSPAYEVCGIGQPDKISADLATQAANMFNCSTVRYGWKFIPNNLKAKQSFAYLSRKHPPRKSLFI